MLSSKLGHFLDKPLSILAKKLDIAPDSITVAGFIITVIAAIVLTRDLFAGGLLIILGALFDVFDGISARVNNRATEFGAFLDSVLDRYSDAFLFLGFAWYFLENNSPAGAYLSIATMVGALLISYARARAEGLGRDCHTGLMERPERIILMSFGALTGLILPVMWILFVLTHITVIQRVYYVKKIMKYSAEERKRGSGKVKETS